MKLAGVIAEYNPFHNGHCYHLAKTREQGISHIAVVMSGSFVQRGDIAICSKWTRAGIAIRNGADLVVELPTAYAAASAQTFARGGVYLLSQLGADCLSFGSEQGDTEALRTAATLSDEAEQSKFMEDLLGKGYSYPRARAEAVAAMHGREWAEMITHANNLLGVEYIRAIRELAPAMSLITTERFQTIHDDSRGGETIASASFVRRILRKGEFAELKRYVPNDAYECYIDELSKLRAPVTERAVERILLDRLRQMEPEQFARLPDVSEGLENRLYRAARSAVSLEDFYIKVKTKRYTMARIRRISFYALLGICKEDQQGLPAYIRVLAANRRGMEILARVRDRLAIPVGSKFAALHRLHPAGIDIDVRATDLYSLAMPEIRPCAMDFLTNPIIIE